MNQQKRGNQDCNRLSVTRTREIDLSDCLGNQDTISMQMAVFTLVPGPFRLQTSQNQCILAILFTVQNKGKIEKLDFLKIQPLPKIDTLLVLTYPHVRSIGVETMLGIGRN